jgi:hypothetical protein
MGSAPPWGCRTGILAAAWRMILDQVRSWVLTVVEQLIDFVTEDHH